MKSRGRSPVLVPPYGASASQLSGLPSGSTAPFHRTTARGSHPSGRSSSDHGDHALGVPKAPSDSGSEGVAEGASPYHRTQEDSDNSGLGNSIFYDDTDAVLQGTPEMTQKALEQIQGKIEKTRELIREEQTSRDDNVNEYLKLSSNADRQQQARIKQVFEKKNQKSSQNIIHYQKKLEEYQKKLQDIQEHGIKPRQTHKLGQGLKSVGGNIRDGISGMSNTVMAKPKEFAHLLRHRFGSADDLSTLAKDNTDVKLPHHGSASLPRENSGGGLSKSSYDTQSKRKCISDDGRRSDRSASVDTTSDSNDPPPPRGAESSTRGAELLPVHQEATEQENLTEWKAVMQELMLHKEEVDHLREEMDELRQHFKLEVEALSYQLREERDRYDRLEEQINDMTELHQHEIENIKSVVNDMEEKVQYQSEERLLDIKEHLQSLETKVTSMEHQQTQQQYLNIDGLDSTDARAIMMKLLTAVITVVHVFLFVMGTVMNLVRPFLRTTSRAVVTLVILVVAGCIYYQQEALMKRFKSRQDSPVS